MKRTNNPNINTKTYWNTRYFNRAAYEEETGTNRFEYALKLINDGDKVLDIGCGIGTFTGLVANSKKDTEVWGVDISSKAIDDNAQLGDGVTYKTHFIGKKPPFPSNYFDFVFSGEVLEHIDDPSSLFQEAYKALKPGGTFFLTTPNKDSIKSEEHVWEFGFEDVEQLFFQNNFSYVRFHYLGNLEHLYVIMASGVKK